MQKKIEENSKSKKKILVLPILSDDRLIGNLAKFNPFQAFISRSPFLLQPAKYFAKLAKGKTMKEDVLPFCSTLSLLIHPFLKFVLSITTQCSSGIQTKLLVENNGRRHTSVQFSSCRLPIPSISWFLF